MVINDRAGLGMGVQVLLKPGVFSAVDSDINLGRV
jgi:hypothetical protein